MRRINAATGVAPFADVRVRDLGDCWIERPFALEGAHDEIAAFYQSRRCSRRDAGSASAATIRSACRSCAPSAPRARSA